MTSAHTTETELIQYTQPALPADTELPTYSEATHELDGGFSLPPTDGGKHAWLLLFACFMLEGIIWGVILIYQRKRLLLTATRIWFVVWGLPRVLQHP